MSRFIEFARQLFGEGTPRHTFKALVQGNKISVDVEIEQPKGVMVVKYKPGTEIYFANEEKGYRPFREDEVIFAKEIHFFGMGMSNGQTTKDVYFKALDDPLEVNPLQIMNGGT